MKNIKIRDTQLFLTKENFCHKERCIILYVWQNTLFVCYCKSIVRVISGKGQLINTILRNGVARGKFYEP